MSTQLSNRCRFQLELAAELALLAFLALCAGALLPACAGDTTRGSDDSDIEAGKDDFCEAYEDCSGESADTCEMQVSAQQQEAEELGCTDTHHAVVDCLGSTARCEGGTFQVTCDAEFSAHAQCVIEAGG